MKEKIGKFEFINIKNLCSAKDAVKRMKSHRLGENIYETPI